MSDMRKGRVEASVRRKRKAEFEWPEADPERYPDEPCRCGGVAKHNGFAGEYYCSKCKAGYAYG